MMLTRLERNCHVRLRRFTGREWKCVKLHETLSPNRFESNGFIADSTTSVYSKPVIFVRRIAASCVDFVSIFLQI